MIVSNTFIKKSELDAYLELAWKYKYNMKTIRAGTAWDVKTLFHRNTHKVPAEIIQRQIERYQPLADETEWQDGSRPNTKFMLEL